MKKRLFLLFILLLISVGLTGCTTTNRDELFDYTSMEVDELDSIDTEKLNSLLVEEGKLTVGTSPDYAPYSFTDLELNGISRVQGSESAIAFYVAKSLGLELVFKQIAFDGLSAELSSGGIDVIFSGLTYSEDRALNFTFTDSYYKSGDGGQVLLVRKDKASLYNSLDDLNKSNITIGAQAASLQFDLVTSQISNATIQSFTTTDGTVAALNSGQIHLMASSTTYAQEVLKAYPDLMILESFQFEVEEYGTMGLLQKNSELTAFINAAIDTLEDGTYAQWLEYFQEYSDAISIEYSSSMIGRVIQIIQKYGLYFLQGTGVTLILSLITVLFGTIIGMLTLLLRKTDYKILKGIGTVYVEVVRGVPLLLQLWVIYLISPSSWSPFVSVAVALIINSGAYVSEIIRAGIDAIDKGQYEACRSLGLSKFQAMKKVVFPQAVKKISPALGNEFVMLIKETSLASVFFVGDLMTIKNTITSITYLSLEPFIVIAIIYFVLTFSATKLIKILENKLEA